MKNQNKYWTKIFSQYKESGLTRPAFCKQAGVPYSQFQYRWYKQKQTTRISPSVKQSEPHLFESIAITNPASESMPSSARIELVIYLPNQVRCAITNGLMQAELPALLKQLVTLC